MKINAELKSALEKVPGAYFDFVHGMCAAVGDDIALADKLIRYMNENPYANDCEVTTKFNEYIGLFPINK